MPRLSVRILLFVSSYAPLLVIANLQFYDKLGAWSYVFTGMACASVIELWRFFTVSRRIAANLVTVDSAKSMNAEALNYVATYVFPFLDPQPDDWKYALGLLILFAMLGVIYISSNMIHINPLLNMCGFRLLEVEIDGTVFSLITRRRFIARGIQVRVRRLGDDVLMEAA